MEINDFDVFKPKRLGGDASPEVRDKPGCYVIKHVPTGKMYVGSSECVGKRIITNISHLNNGRHKNEKIQNAFTSDHDLVVLLKTTDTVEEAIQLEQTVVNELTGSDALCNIGILDVSLPCKGRTLTEEHRAALVKANTGRVKSIEEIEKTRLHSLGRPCSERTKQRLTETHKGVPKSEEQREKMSLSQRAYAKSEEGVARYAKNADINRETKSKPVTIDGVHYPSIKIAADAIGVSSPTIRNRIDNPKFDGYREG